MSQFYTILLGLPADIFVVGSSFTPLLNLRSPHSNVDHRLAMYRHVESLRLVNSLTRGESQIDDLLSLGPIDSSA